MARVAPVILAVALWVYGLIDCAQTPPEKMPKGLSKPVWMLIVLLVPAFGALAWLVVKGLAATSGGQVGLRRRPKRPTAPDEDPEFLANLDWQARKAYYERQKKQQEAAAAETNDAADSAAAAAESAAVQDASEAPEHSEETDAQPADPFEQWERDLEGDDGSDTRGA